VSTVSKSSDGKLIAKFVAAVKCHYMEEEQIRNAARAFLAEVRAVSIAQAKAADGGEPEPGA